MLREGAWLVFCCDNRMSGLGSGHLLPPMRSWLGYTDLWLAAIPSPWTNEMKIKSAKYLGLILVLAAICGILFLTFWERSAGSGFFEKSTRTPIVFYGKVADQNGVPIAGAEITLLPNDSLVSGTRHPRQTKSDAQGLFSVSDMKGMSLGVEVRKAGYYPWKPKNGETGWAANFYYGGSPEMGLHHPDSSAPVVFHLYKVTQIEPLRHIKKSFEMPKDGSPVVVDFGSGTDGVPLKLQFRAWVSDEKKNALRQYDWRFEFKVVEGRLQIRKYQYDFLAPQSGYDAETTGCDMPSNLDPKIWQNEFEGDYFFKFNNGVFGRIYLRMSGFGGHLLDVDAYINPIVGSRALEAEPRRD